MMQADRLLLNGLDMNTQPSTTEMLQAEAEAAISELYTAAALSMPWLKDEDMGEALPVMVMPGFLCGDQFTALMRYFLGHRGFSVYGWELHPAVDHLGCEKAMLDLRTHLRSLHERYQKKVSLLAWGEGRSYAGDLAGNCPECVEQVILLGMCARPEASHANISPLNSPAAINVNGWREIGASDACFSQVPVTAICSEVDLSISWHCNDGSRGSSRENIEVFHRRCGRTFNPGVLNAIITCLTGRQSIQSKLESVASKTLAHQGQVSQTRSFGAGI